MIDGDLHIDTPLPLARPNLPTPWTDSRYVRLLHRKLNALLNLSVVGGRVIKTDAGFTIQMDNA